MKNDAIINSILCLLTAYKKMNSTNSNKMNKASLRYLLGQSIRQYDIPLSNRHVSKEARSRWDEISKSNIEDYHYRNVVVCDNLKVPKQYLLFNGANGSGEPTKLMPGSTFIFREMFHEDHVIPVSLILREMIEMVNVNRIEIKNLLDKMHLCVLLKEEDRKIGRTKGRTLHYNQNIINIYNKAGISIL